MKYFVADNKYTVRCPSIWGYVVGFLFRLLFCVTIVVCCVFCVCYMLFFCYLFQWNYKVYGA